MPSGSGQIPLLERMNSYASRAAQWHRVGFFFRCAIADWRRRLGAMAPGTPHRHHHAHETTDAFAEGWDAREQAVARGQKDHDPVNPYRVELQIVGELHSKRSARQVENMRRDAELWDQGWHERMEVERLEGV